MIELKDLTKKFDDFTAVDHLNLTVETGEFFGLLGSNGAGKTTTISMMSTVLIPTEGGVYIDGELLTRGASEVKRKISVITQEYSMRQDMTVEQVMEYQGRLYYMKRAEIKAKTQELLEFAGLWPYRKRTVRFLSGGMKRKLMICRGLMIEPEILLLDEPTAGMDALARRQTWELLRQINRGNLTIILTTHYMEEAETLCDRVAIIDKGKLDIIETPANLIHDLGNFCVDEPEDGRTVSHFFEDRPSAIEYLQGRSNKAILRSTSLEDVFIERLKKK